MLNLKLLSTFTLSAFAFIGVVGNHLVTSSIDEKTIDLSAFKNLYTNASSYRDSSKEIQSEPELKKEELVISAINRELDRAIVRSRIFNSNKIAKTQSTVHVDEVKLNFSAVKKEPVLKVRTSKAEAIKIEKINEANNQSLEINNNDEFQAKKFSHDKIMPERFVVNEFKYEETAKEENKIQPENNSKEIAIINKVDNEDDADDIVMFDYNKPEPNKAMDKKLYERPLSETVKNVIKREIGSIPKFEMKYEKVESSNQYDNKIVSELSKKLESGFGINDDLLNPNNENSESEDQIVFDYSSVKKQNFTQTIESNKNAFTGEAFNTIEINVKSAIVDILNGKAVVGTSFEFEPDYDRNDRVHDNNSGELSITAQTSQQNSSLTGIFKAKDSIVTRTDLIMNTHNVVVPLFNEEKFKEFLMKQGAETENAILISLSAEINDVEIDSEYSKKLYLNSTFKPTENNKKFVMFLGVKSGNILLKYNVEGKTAQKIIFVGDSEIYFEEPSFISGERETFELVSKSMLANNLKELNISNRDVKLFNTNIFSKKAGLNSYEIKMPTQILGNRKYLEIKNEDNLVFVGMEKAGTVEVPNKEYVAKILEGFKVAELDNKCLVQVNIQKPISKIKMSGKNGPGEMFTETMFLDNDGKLGSIESEETQKMFVLGENEGIISINLEYSNGTSDNLKTYCSNGTFLIEQLK